MASELVPEDERLTDRNGLIWRDYCAGRTQAWLAKEYGLSQARVSQIISQVRDGIPEERREEMVERSLELLRDLQAGAVEIYRMAPAPVFVGKDGDPAIDPDSGEYVRDHSGRLRALETAVKVNESVRKLLGLDAAQKLDMHVEAGEVRAAAALAEEARARLERAEEAGDVG